MIGKNRGARNRVGKPVGLAMLLAACSLAGCSSASDGPKGGRMAGGGGAALTGGAIAGGGTTSLGGNMIMPVGSSTGTGSGGTTDTTDSGTALSSRDPISIDDCGPNNPADLSDQDAQALMAGGAVGAAR